MKVLKTIFISLLLIFNVSVIESASLASMPYSAGAPQDYFYDGFENGIENWPSVLLQGSVNPWEISNLNPNSGAYNLQGNDLPTVSNTCVKMKTAVTVPSNAFLNFIHAYDLDYFCDLDVGCEYFDGGIVQYSTSGGLTWIDAGSLFTENGYNGTISSDFDNPLRSKNAFVGSTNDYISTKLNLNDLAGENVIFRFCISTDTENYGTPLGWIMDDVHIYTCDNTITTTAIPTTTTSVSTVTTVPTNSTTVPPTTTTTVPVNIINATSLLKQISGPIIFDKKNVWMILSAAGHHFNQPATSITITIVGPEETSQGVSLNKRRKAFSFGKFIFVPLTIQKGATSGEWKIQITTRLSNPAQEEKVTATINIQTASTTVPPTTTTTSVPSSTTTTSGLTSTTSAMPTTTTTLQPTTTTSVIPTTSTTSLITTTTTSILPATTSTTTAMCVYSIAPLRKSFKASGGTGTVSVTTQEGCSWTAVSNDTGWIIITSGSSGIVTGKVSYTVAANTSTTSRTGIMTIAGETFTVTQEGSAGI
jgi:hypothetical protein